MVALCDVFDDADTIAENPQHTPDELATTIVNLFVATDGDRTSDLLAHLMRTEIEDTGTLLHIPPTFLLLSFQC